MLRCFLRRRFSAGSVDAGEVDKFARDAAKWWDNGSQFRALHAMHRTRMQYVAARLGAMQEKREGRRRPLEGLHVLDMGCGGGLLTHSLLRLGAHVTAVDAGEATVDACRAAVVRARGVDETRAVFRHATAEQMASEAASFDAVCSLEVVEHVADRQAFVESLATMTRVGGVLTMSTINDTAKARTLAIGLAEYVLRLVPVGTHEADKLTSPADLERGVAPVGRWEAPEVVGMTYVPGRDTWRLSDDPSVNYLWSARRLE